MNLQLETKNLILRPFEFSDAESFFEMDKNPNVHKYLWNKPTEQIDETIKTIEMVKKQYLEHNIGRFAIELKTTKQFIGWAGIKFCTEIVNKKSDFHDIGYRLDERFWGKGYATEASFAWLEYGFHEMKIETMMAGAQSLNIASNRILEKIGMKLTDQYLEDGSLWNWFEMKNPCLT